MAEITQFKDVQGPLSAGAVPRGSCDGLMIGAAGTISYTTLAGTKIVGHAVVAGQLVPVRVQSVDTITSATVFAGYLVG